MLIGILSVQFGAGIAKTLFDDVPPTGIVWLRLASSTLVLLAWSRPRLRGRDRAAWLTVLGFGVSLGTMNWAIYQAFSRIPIGIAVTVEFVGPMAIAAFGFRRPRDLAWVGLAAVGVVLLGAERTGFDAAGFAFAVLAGGSWAAYILLSARTGRRWEGLDGLAVASLVATLLLTPTLAVVGDDGVFATHAIVVGAAVGMLSSVVPYSCELIALRRLEPATFGVLMSLEPAAAALAGLMVVGESLGAVQWAAIGCVIVASIGATRVTSSPIAEPVPD